MPIAFAGDADKYYDPVAAENFHEVEIVPEPRRHLWRKPWFWALCAVGVTILIIAATVGGVLGSRKADRQPSNHSDR
jgi:hypothetical protein